MKIREGKTFMFPIGMNAYPALIRHEEGKIERRKMCLSYKWVALPLRAILAAEQEGSMAGAIDCWC